MNKKLYSLSIRGRSHEWSFNVMIDPRNVEAWRSDGIEIHELVNTIPAWVVHLGLMRVWIFLQDFFYFKNPFAR